MAGEGEPAVAAPGGAAGPINVGEEIPALSTDEQQVRDVIAQMASLRQEMRQEHASRSEMLDLESNVEDLVMRISSLEGSGTEGHGRGLQRMTERKQFFTVPKYAGNQESYGDWCFGMRGFLESELGFGSYLAWIEKTPMEKLTDSGVKECALHEGMPLDAGRGAMSLAWLDRNLWEVMQGNMTGGAVKRIKGVIKKDWRGAGSWRTILDDAIGMSGQIYTGIVNRLFEAKSRLPH